MWQVFQMHIRSLCYQQSPTNTNKHWSRKRLCLPICKLRKSVREVILVSVSHFGRKPASMTNPPTATSSLSGYWLSAGPYLCRFLKHRIHQTLVSAISGCGRQHSRLDSDSTLKFSGIGSAMLSNQHDRESHVWICRCSIHLIYHLAQLTRIKLSPVIQAPRQACSSICWTSASYLKGCWACRIDIGTES